MARTVFDIRSCDQALRQLGGVLFLRRLGDFCYTFESRRLAVEDIQLGRVAITWSIVFATTLRFLLHTYLKIEDAEDEDIW